MEGKTKEKSIEKKVVGKCCEWGYCSDNGYETDSEVMIKCDFRKLKKDKLSILKRIDDEVDSMILMMNNLKPGKRIMFAFRGKFVNHYDVKRDMLDKMMGVHGLCKVLYNEFDYKHVFYDSNILKKHIEDSVGIGLGE